MIRGPPCSESPDCPCERGAGLPHSRPHPSPLWALCAAGSQHKSQAVDPEGLCAWERAACQGSSRRGLSQCKLGDGPFPPARGGSDEERPHGKSGAWFPVPAGTYPACSVSWGGSGPLSGLSFLIHHTRGGIAQRSGGTWGPKSKEDSAQARLWAVEGAPGWDQPTWLLWGCVPPAGPRPPRAWVV